MGDVVTGDGCDGSGQVVQFGELVLGQGFGREEIERAGRRVAEQGVKDGQVVAERLAAGRGGDDGHVFAGQRMGDGLAW